MYVVIKLFIIKAIEFNQLSCSFQLSFTPKFLPNNNTGNSVQILQRETNKKQLYTIFSEEDNICLRQIHQALDNTGEEQINMI